MMNPSRKDIEKAMKEKFGFVPDFYNALPDSALPGAWNLHEQFELEETELDNLTKELIGLSMASHIKCKYCIYYHTQTAKALGASDQQIREAIVMGGSTVLFSNSISGTQVDFEQFKKDVDQAIENMAEKAA